MSLSHVNWRYVGTQSFSIGSLPAVMDAIFLLGNASQYADGSSRTPGSGSAGNWSKQTVSNSTECVYVAPAGSTLPQRILLAGASYTPTSAPVMASPDTYTTNTLHIGMVKNPGAFVSWTSPEPFTAGENFGYWRVWPTSVGAGNVYLWEGRGVVAVAITNQSGSAAYGAIAGAIIDPESDDTTTDAETDGAMYGIITGGTTAAISTSFWSSSNAFLQHQATAGGPHAGVFSPGSSLILTMNPRMRFTVAQSVTGLKTRSGRYGRLALAMACASPDNLLGRLREVYAYSDAQMPARQVSGSAPIGYIFGSATNAPADAVLLEH